MTNKSIRRSLVVGGIILLAILACNDHGLNPIEESISASSIEKEFQKPYTMIDILWIVDNSGSMCEEQDNLTRNFEIFVDGLVGLNARFRLAVVTTDLKNESHQGRFQNTPAREANETCDINGDGIPDQPNTSDCPMDLPTVIDSDNYLLNPDDINGGLRESDLRRDFRCIATVGTSGDGFEKGLEASRLALGANLLNSYNAGFLRDDAYLVVIFLTDENDCSDTYDPLPRSNGNECEWERARLVPVQEYADFIMSLKPDPSDIVVATIVAPNDGINYDAPQMVQPSCSIEGLGEGYNGYRYLELVEYFGANGVDESICQAEYSSALNRIIEIVGEMVNRWCLATPPPACETEADCPGEHTCVDYGGRGICSNWNVLVQVREGDQTEFSTMVANVDYSVNYTDNACINSQISISFLPGRTPNPDSEIRIVYEKEVGLQ